MSEKEALEVELASVAATASPERIAAIKAELARFDEPAEKPKPEKAARKPAETRGE